MAKKASFYKRRSCIPLQGFKGTVGCILYLLLLFEKKQLIIFLILSNQGNNETLLCSLANFDVYTFTRTVKKSPTKFMFALKSQDNIAIFENPDNYMHYLCADHFDKMNDWVLSLRAAKVTTLQDMLINFILVLILTMFLFKNILTRADSPERFIEKSIEMIRSEVGQT